MDRKEYLLRQVLKMFKQQDKSDYVLEINRISLIYDGVECDGNCLKEDIMAELGIEDLDELEEEQIIE